MDLFSLPLMDKKSSLSVPTVNYSKGLKIYIFFTIKSKRRMTIKNNACYKNNPPALLFTKVQKLINTHQDTHHWHLNRHIIWIQNYSLWSEQNSYDQRTWVKTGMDTSRNFIMSKIWDFSLFTTILQNAK